MTLERGTLFQPQLVTDLINKVTGASSLAALSGQTPIPFNGQKEFVFTMDSEIDVVAESGAKSRGGVTLTPRTIIPIKVEYGARVSDEFMYAAEEEKISILQAFNDGFARKVARGLDLMAYHGVNPRTGLVSAVIGDNNFDTAVDNVVQAALSMATANADIEAAIAMIEEGDISGMAIAPAFRSALAKLVKTDGNAMFPELAWGNAPSTINGLNVQVSRNVSDMSTARDRVVIGDFAGSFKWGYAKQIPLEIIQFGDPDNSGLDLKGYNQVYLRAEVYLGWGNMEPDNFAVITEAAV